MNSDLSGPIPSLTDSRPERAGGGRTDGLMDRRMDERKSPVYYRTLPPLGPLPCFPSLEFAIIQSRAMGIADHLLGDLLFVRLAVCHSYTPPPRPLRSQIRPVMPLIWPFRPQIKPLRPQLWPLKPKLRPLKLALSGFELVLYGLSSPDSALSNQPYHALDLNSARSGFKSV